MKPYGAAMTSAIHFDLIFFHAVCLFQWDGAQQGGFAMPIDHNRF